MVGHTLRQLFLNTDDSHIESMQAFLDEYMASTNPGLPVTSRQTMAEQYQAQTRSSAVMGNAVSVVIALVGVLNFINSMVTAIVSRRREFAVMQSVGMTKKQLCRMLVNEGLYYAGLTLLFSYLISAFAVGGCGSGDGGGRLHHLPLHPAAAGGLHAGSYLLRGADSLSLLPQPGQTQYCRAPPLSSGLNPRTIALSASARRCLTLSRRSLASGCARS